MIVDAHVTINGTRAEVWNTITNIRNGGNIIRGIEKTEILDEPADKIVGLKWMETRMYFGKPTAIEKCITEASELEFYKTSAEMDGFIFLTTFTIKENGNLVTLTSAHETKAKNIVAKIKSLPMIFFRRMLRNAILQDLDDIKSAVENHSTSNQYITNLNRS